MDFINLFCHAFLPVPSFEGIERRPERILDMFRVRRLIDGFFQLFIFFFFELRPFDFLNLEIEDTQEACLFPFVFLQFLRFTAQAMPMGVHIVIFLAHLF